MFTTLALLGLLALCKRGSVDGTFRACTRHWRQIFIVMLEYKGSFLPVAMAWLPDKTALSYYTCLALLLIAFKAKKDEIQSLYGRSQLRLKKIKCDYEASIHIGWGMFSLSGCYFHFTQSIWRKIQELGLVSAFMKDKEVKDFVRIINAIPFLPINRIGKFNHNV